MASFIKTVKRKLSSILPFARKYKSTSTDDLEKAAGDEGNRPQKRRRLNSFLTPPVLRSYSAALDQSGPLIYQHPLNFNQQVFAPSPALTEVSLSTEPAFSEAKINGDKNSGEPSAFLRMLPSDVISHCFSFLATKSERFGLQVTCTSFRKLSNVDDMLKTIDVGGTWSATSKSCQIDDDGGSTNSGEEGEDEGGGGNAEAVDEEENHGAEEEPVGSTGAPLSGGGWMFAAPHGVLTDDDTSVTACGKLIKFAAAGNMQAVYMLGMILCYCHENVNEGLSLLRHAARHGHLRSTYALALILRDSRRPESDYYLDLAASRDYAPAWQEKLTATEMRLRFGDLDASKLVKYLDPPCLNRLFGRHYLECRRARENQTSHCWNPLCGRWAYKATSLRGEEYRQRRVVRLQLEPMNNEVDSNEVNGQESQGPSTGPRPVFSLECLMPQSPSPAAEESSIQNYDVSQLGGFWRSLYPQSVANDTVLKVSRMKMCSSCRRAKYCSKLCQVYDWRSGRHKMECQFL